LPRRKEIKKKKILTMAQGIEKRTHLRVLMYCNRGVKRKKRAGFRYALCASRKKKGKWGTVRRRGGRGDSPITLGLIQILLPKRGEEVTGNISREDSRISLGWERFMKGRGRRGGTNSTHIRIGVGKVHTGISYQGGGKRKREGNPYRRF